MTCIHDHIVGPCRVLFTSVHQEDSQFLSSTPVSSNFMAKMPSMSCVHICVFCPLLPLPGTMPPTTVCSKSPWWKYDQNTSASKVLSESVLFNVPILTMYCSPSWMICIQDMIVQAWSVYCIYQGWWCPNPHLPLDTGVERALAWISWPSLLSWLCGIHVCLVYAWCCLSSLLYCCLFRYNETIYSRKV